MKDFISKEDAKQAAMMFDMFKQIADRINNEDDDEKEHKGVVPRVDKQTVENIKRLGGELLFECLQDEPNLLKIGYIESLLGSEAIDAGYIDSDRDMPQNIKRILNKVTDKERAFPIVANRFVTVTTDAYKARMESKYGTY